MKVFLHTAVLLLITSSIAQALPGRTNNDRFNSGRRYPAREPMQAQRLEAPTFMANSSWRIVKPEWTSQDEAKFAAFLVSIGGAVERRECETVDGCLRSSANPYRNTDPANLRLFADCADLPYYLRAYFAWKNGLPFSFVSSVSIRPGDGDPGKDPRYSRFGNVAVKRYSVVSLARGSRVVMPDAVTILNRTLINSTYTGTFRMIGDQDGSVFSDFYPVKLNRQGIRAGTVIYDPNGHVAIIYRVTEDGRVFYIDSHPDNTLTSGMYTPKFSRSFPYQGAGFKNFRPLSLQGAKRDSSGVYYGGKIVGAKNASLPQFSYEQFYGTNPDPAGDWKKGKFLFNGQPLAYFDYVRIKLASPGFRLDPLLDIKELTQDICVSVKDRVVAVNTAIKSGVANKEHPVRLPMNIYGSQGEWEDYASPARDARLKVSYMDLLAQAKQLLERWKARDPSLVYNGGNLAADLLNIYTTEARSCRIAYTNSDRRAVTLDVDQIRQRVFDLSFDPYHCVEYRWGASSAQELASCRDNDNKREWYAREVWLRNQWERRYDVRMDFSLEELTGPMPGAGIAQPPDVDIVRFLTSQK
ncbi:hypothetical protein D3C87_571890 [compost metagenome]